MPRFHFWLAAALLPVALVQAQNVAQALAPELAALLTPKDNPSSAERVALGRALFNDKRLSDDNTVSCATCHDADAGFTARLKTAKGIRDQMGKRNARALFSARRADLEDGTRQVCSGRQSDLP
jgi:cytochrome c peroxidase